MQKRYPLDDQDERNERFETADMDFDRLYESARTYQDQKTRRKNRKFYKDEFYD